MWTKVFIFFLRKLTIFISLKFSHTSYILDDIFWTPVDEIFITDMFIQNLYIFMLI